MARLIPTSIDSPQWPRTRARLIAAFIARYGVTRCPPRLADGLGPLDSLFWCESGDAEPGLELGAEPGTGPAHAGRRLPADPFGADLTGMGLFAETRSWDEA